MPSRRRGDEVARIVVLVIPSQVPDQGIVRSQDSTERSWFKVSRFCYMLMKYSCDRQLPSTRPPVAARSIQRAKPRGDDTPWPHAKMRGPRVRGADAREHNRA